MAKPPQKTSPPPRDPEGTSSKRLSRSAEDYLEVVGALCREYGHAQVSMIAARLGVRKPSVTVAMRHLSALGLVEYRPYAPIRLTEQGGRYANDVINAHDTLKHFFMEAAGLSEQRADEVACQMEHVLTYPEINAIAHRISPPN